MYPQQFKANMKTFNLANLKKSTKFSEGLKILIIKQKLIKH